MILILSIYRFCPYYVRNVLRTFETNSVNVSTRLFTSHLKPVWNNAREEVPLRSPYYNINKTTSCNVKPFARALGTVKHTKNPSHRIGKETVVNLVAWFHILRRLPVRTDNSLSSPNTTRQMANHLLKKFRK